MYVRPKCNQCKNKLPKNDPELFCDICCELKHLRCEKLTKSDVKNLNRSRNYWTCYSCLSSILPIECSEGPELQPILEKSANAFKQKCGSCNGYSYTPRTVDICWICDEKVHIKCLRGTLGCVSCLKNVYPGFECHGYELLDKLPNSSNNTFYNPYHSSHFTQQLGNLLDEELDRGEAWSELSTLLQSCKYKEPKETSEPKADELNILSLNIQSIVSKFTDLRENIDKLAGYDIICLNETNCQMSKLPHGKCDLELDGFHEPIVREPIRKSGRGGGLIMYVNKRVGSVDNIVEFDPNPEPSNTAGEFQFVKIQNCKQQRRTIIVGNVYRSPSRKASSFIELYEAVLHRVQSKHSNKLIYVVGDLNLDLIKHSTDSACRDLIDMSAAKGFAQVVSRPTRITDHSATLIDHVYTNSLDATMSCNIITFDISDHLAVHTKAKLANNTVLSKIQHTKTSTYELREFNSANDDVFWNLLANETWEEVREDLGAQGMYNKFTEVLVENHYNSAYPVESKRIRRKNERRDPKPWMLPWLEDACARKQRLYTEYVKNNTSIAKKLEYEKLKLFCTKHCDLAKSRYMKARFEEHKNNSKKQWEIINGLLNRNRKKSGVDKLLDSNGTVLTDPQAVSSRFNEYFTSIPSKLKEMIASRNPDKCANGFQSFLKDEHRIGESFVLEDVVGTEVQRIIANFKNKATQDIRMSSLKIANKCQSFYETLAKVINQSFKEGVFPSQLKIAKVIPIHKNGSKVEASNYRPISLLASISKIYEKLVHHRLLEYLEKHNVLYGRQYGFRPGRSCEHALLDAQHKLLHSMNKRQVSLLLLIDFSKAFDLVDHDILLRKLEHYGIRGIALKWMESYLKNREQFVFVNGSSSTKLNIKYGVPQGSILGPLLFIIYANDLPLISQIAHFIMYADDANIIITGDSVQSVLTLADELVLKLISWVDSNGLCLNLKKTQYMIFSRSKVQLDSPLVIANTRIERVKEVRFLGVIVDEKLNWSTHINSLRAKMCRYVGIMYRTKKYLPQKARLQIYHSFIQSHVNYCSLVWGFSAKSKIDLIFSKQKMGLRSVIPGFTRYRYRDGHLPGHTKEFFNEYNILSVGNIVAMNSILLIHRTRRFPESLPSTIRELFDSDSPRNGDSHEDCQRWLDMYNNSTFRASIFFKGPLVSIVESVDSEIDLNTVITIAHLKARTKRAILTVQKTGDRAEWNIDNFVLSRISGLRKSKRDGGNK